MLYWGVVVTSHLWTLLYTPAHGHHLVRLISIGVNIFVQVKWMPSLTLRKFWDETKCTFLGMAAQCISTELTDGAQDNECGVSALTLTKKRWEGLGDCRIWAIQQWAQLARHSLATTTITSTPQSQGLSSDVVEEEREPGSLAKANKTIY